MSNHDWQWTGTTWIKQATMSSAVYGSAPSVSESGSIKPGTRGNDKMLIRWHKARLHQTETFQKKSKRPEDRIAATTTTKDKENRCISVEHKPTTHDSSFACLIGPYLLNLAAWSATRAGLPAGLLVGPLSLGFFAIAGSGIVVLFRELIISSSGSELEASKHVMTKLPTQLILSFRDVIT